MGEYAGESIAKKVARIRLYKRTRQALKYFDYKLENVKVLFLPGPQATEVGVLKYLLKTQPKNVVAVDKDPEVCQWARMKWPGITAVCGDLMYPDTVREVRSVCSTYDFIHLDLMGTLSANSELLYAQWSNLCETNGVMAVTYLRGREQKITPISRQCQLFGEKMRDARKHSTGDAKKYLHLMSADPVRSYAHLMALKVCGAVGLLQQNPRYDDGLDITDGMTDEDINDVVLRAAQWRMVEDHVEYGSFTPLATYAYRSEYASMGVLAVQKVYHDVLESDSYALLRYDRSRHSTSIIKKDPMEDLLLEADSLEKDFTKDQVAEMLGVTKGTLAAWRAHRTMGTYERAA